MCFRPSIAETSVNCPHCGKKTNAVMGTIPNVCPFCEADLEELTRNINKDVPSTAPTNPTPVALGASGPPKAPDAPRTPGAPKPPVNRGSADQ